MACEQSPAKETMNTRCRVLAVALPLVGLISGCRAPSRTLTLLDSETGRPVEGALVFAPGETRGLPV